MKKYIVPVAYLLGDDCTAWLGPTQFVTAKNREDAWLKAQEGIRKYELKKNPPEEDEDEGCGVPTVWIQEFYDDQSRLIKLKNLPEGLTQKPEEEGYIMGMPVEYTDNLWKN